MISHRVSAQPSQATSEAFHLHHVLQQKYFTEFHKGAFGDDSQAFFPSRNAAMDDSIGGAYGVAGFRVQCVAQPSESELLDARGAIAS